mmetsp:Transcript_12316/g.23077  ORF Transcript_12316/g.23077 Transcript_12316/m.23077 type:complete len:213 (+) Transcript_12316:177-815(+)|eukprot:CAMPEP_0176494020 /NCGR_PEP_ID=MMETSP0200_2-20121128/9862_1 /TAXON_ID=947934 /ORGANISM="Chaetoceros sp., Strain GSL56" /LENGTH=212 /DNA_ID=CAMNT_0017891727 /DNA_START=128 /DNA_END=766 /DNA_ORIENTATION=-
MSPQDESNADAAAITSALRENINSKGKNAYYFAHANTPKGPTWDGKPEPRLLAKHSSVGTDDNNMGDSEDTQHVTHGDAQKLLQSLKQKQASFDFTKSNITKYSFLDDGAKVKIYVVLKGVGEICKNDDDITLEWKEKSFSLAIRNYTEEGKDESEVKCLCFGRLHGSIQNASFKKKTDKVIITLTKLVKEGEEPKEWPGVGAKGDPEHELL